MADNIVINYAQDYQAALEQTFQTENSALRSADLWNSPSNSFIRFDGAKHIKVPTLTINSGRRNRNRRSTDHHIADYSNDWNDYELTFDRDWETLVDPMDVDESNMVTSIANITKQFNLTQKLPEMDRYMFSKLYQEKTKKDAGNGVHTDTLDAKNILEAFDSMMTNFDEARIPSDNRVLYVTPQVNKLLKSADAANRAAVITGNGNIQRVVYSLDDVQIKVVPSDLMQTQFDFTVGSTPVDSAEQINMFLIYNGVQLAPQKYSFAGMDAPSAENAGNYHYYERAYADVFLLDSKVAGYEVCTSKKGASASSSKSSK